MVANLPSFAQAIGASFTDLAPRSSQLVAPRVPEQHFREDGSLELPIFVLFDLVPSQRAVLLRQFEANSLVRDLLVLADAPTTTSALLLAAEG